MQITIIMQCIIANHVNFAFLEHICNNIYPSQFNDNNRWFIFPYFSSPVAVNEDDSQSSESDEEGCQSSKSPIQLVQLQPTNSW